MREAYRPQAVETPEQEAWVVCSAAGRREAASRAQGQPVDGCS